MAQLPHGVVIDENRCIGCSKCIQACPVDAIIGAPKQMHTVLPTVCIGCDLCIEPCPVDCIHLVPIAPLTPDTKKQRAVTARIRSAARKQRLQQKQTIIANQFIHIQALESDLSVKQQAIQAALARHRAKRPQRS
jgi:Na+-translocating ferredoxin:NAD+ oxidoreductase subunit B